MDHNPNNRHLLSEALSGAQAGLFAVDLLRGKTSDPEMIASLERQASEYRKIEMDAETRLNRLMIEEIDV